MHMVAFSQPRRISCSPLEVLGLHTLMGHGVAVGPLFSFSRIVSSRLSPANLGSSWSVKVRDKVNRNETAETFPTFAAIKHAA